MNKELLIKKLKNGDQSEKLSAMNQLIAGEHSIADFVIAELFKVDDPTLIWALEGIDYYEESRKQADPNAGIVQDTVGFKSWYVLAYAKVLVAHQESTLSKLTTLLPTERSTLNAMIAFILGEIGNQQAIPVLVDRLDSSEVIDKLRAVQSLGRLQAVEAVSHLHPLLLHEELRFAVAVALGRIGDVRSVDPLIYQFRRDPHTATVTGTALVKLGSATVEPLISTFSDPNAEPVFGLTAELLGLLGDIRAIPSLIKLVQQPADETTKYSAIVALGKLKAGDAVGLLKNSVLHPTGLNDRFAAIEALASIEYDEAFRFFTMIVKNPEFDFELRCHGLYGYRMLKQLHDIQPLLDAVVDPDPRIRSTAVVQLANLQDERARDTLEVAKSDTDWQTRVWAKEALERMRASL